MSFRLVRPKLLSRTLALAIGAWVGGFPLLAFADVTFSPPPGRGMPGRRESGGTRDACLKRDPKDSSDVKRSLWALVPESNLSLTTSSYPTFFWSIPPTNAQAVEFTLNDENEQEIYRSTFQITGEPGIISISLPAHSSLPPLEVNKMYRWKFALICDVNDSGSNKRLNGWIQRVAVDPKLQAALDKASSRQQPEIYAQAGIWQDALTALSELRHSQPKDKELLATWVSLLKSAALDPVIQEPLVPCCQANNSSNSSPAFNASQGSSAIAPAALSVLKPTQPSSPLKSPF